MPGKMYNGDPLDQPLSRNSRAYCEGRAHAAGGGLVGDDPHFADSPDSVAWVAGFDSWSADPTGVTTQDCCAHAYGAGYVP